MTAPACIRRPNALWTTCRCPRCTAHHRRVIKLHHAGKLNRPAAEQAIALIQTWRAEGYSLLWIATVAHVNAAWVSTVAVGKVTHPGPLLTSRILAADISKGTAGFRSALGARRRLQALAVMGWHLDELGTRYGIPPAVLSRIRSGQACDVYAARHLTIRAAYDELSGIRGPSTMGATRARNLGWAAPAAWDDPDDPAETYGPKVRRATGTRGRVGADLVEDVEWLLEHEPLLTSAEVACRLGYADASAVRNTLVRLGQRGLLARLARNARLAA